MNRRSIALTAISVIVITLFAAYYYGDAMLRAGVLGFLTAIALELFFPTAGVSRRKSLAQPHEPHKWYMYTVALRFLAELRAEVPATERGEPDFHERMFTTQIAIGQLHNDGLIDDESAIRALRNLSGGFDADPALFENIWDALMLAIVKSQAAGIVMGESEKIVMKPISNL